MSEQVVERVYEELPEWGDITHVKPLIDFLPSPAELAGREEDSEKITIFLDRQTVNFFRAQAKEFDASYQRMIRELLKDYVELQQLHY
jgi:hypothetical protein